MAKAYDVKIAFEYPVVKLLFSELFFKKLERPLRTRVIIVDVKKENAYKDLIYTSKWIGINFSESYFDSRYRKRNHSEFSDFIFKFFDYLFINQKESRKNKFLLKIIFKSHKGIRLCFLFDEIPSLDFLKLSFSKAIIKIEEYKSGNVETVKEIKKAFKLKSKEIYYEFKNNSWVVINLLFNAGKYHHDNIARNIYDNRIAKPDILVNEEYLNETIKYKALWRIKANGREFVRVKPNDIALYSNISMANLKKAKIIYENKSSVLWKYIQMAEDEKDLMDYYELIITAIILAYSAVEALINTAIPRFYYHKKVEKNRNTGRLNTKKYSKMEIERWYNIDTKMNIVLPEALNISLPNQQKWWVRFDKLEKLRNKIIHAVDSKSNERYSELLDRHIFEIIESHIEVINFFGRWATDNKHYLLNELPYGFGYDDIMPILISKKDYNEVTRE